MALNKVHYPPVLCNCEDCITCHVLLLQKVEIFPCSIKVCHHMAPKSFSPIYLKQDISYACLSYIHIRAFWLIIAAPCGQSALCWLSRKIGRSGKFGMVVMSKLRMKAVIMHVLLLVHEKRVWIFFCWLLKYVLLITNHFRCFSCKFYNNCIFKRNILYGVMLYFVHCACSSC